jgi:glutaminyl-peptide cyclotransferase
MAVVAAPSAATVSPPARALLLLLLVSCGRTEAPPAREFDADRAMTRVQEQLAFGPRIPGTDAHAAMAAWLDSVARGVADTVVVQRWMHRMASGDSVPMFNIIARFNPAAPTRVLYLAHWDTRPRADAATSAAPDQPVPGANDGASGVALLLGVMDALRANPPEIGVDLLFVDGEDLGSFGPPRVDVLIGSTYYAANPLPPGRPEFAVVWDMVGGQNLRIGRETLSGVAAPAVVTRIWDVAAAMGYGHVFVQESVGAITDDHVPLIDAGIRAVDVIGWPYEHWHTVNDTYDKISRESLEAVGNVAVAVLRQVEP